MTRRIKKPAVRPELRRQWLYRNESLGESPPQIAEADGYDVRTVRSQLEIEVRERERREARAVVLREALEKHYADLCTFAQKLDSHTIGKSTSPKMLREDPMWGALREHQPRSKIWKNLERWDSLHEEIGELDAQLRESLEEAVKSRTRLKYVVSGDKIGICSGIVDALSFHVAVTARGEMGLDKRASFRLTPADKETTRIEYGAFTIGKIPNDQVEKAKNLVLTLLSEVTTWEQQLEMSRLATQLKRVQGDLHDDLLVIILRRIVPGRCKYCPI